MRIRDFDRAMTQVDVGTKALGELNIAQCGRARALVIQTALLSKDHERTLLRQIEVAKAARGKKAKGESKEKVSKK